MVFPVFVLAIGSEGMVVFVRFHWEKEPEWGERWENERFALCRLMGFSWILRLRELFVRT